MGYIISTAYSFDKVDENLVAISSENEKVIILGDVEQFLLERILVMPEAELIEVAKKEFNPSESISEDIHQFIQSLVMEGIIIEKGENVESSDC